MTIALSPGRSHILVQRHRTPPGRPTPERDVSFTRKDWARIKIAEPQIKQQASGKGLQCGAFTGMGASLAHAAEAPEDPLAAEEREEQERIEREILMLMDSLASAGPRSASSLPRMAGEAARPAGGEVLLESGGVGAIMDPPSVAAQHRRRVMEAEAGEIIKRRSGGEDMLAERVGNFKCPARVSDAKAIVAQAGAATSAPQRLLSQAGKMIKAPDSAGESVATEMSTRRDPLAGWIVMKVKPDVELKEGVEATKQCPIISNVTSERAACPINKAAGEMGQAAGGVGMGLGGGVEVTLGEELVKDSEGRPAQLFNGEEVPANSLVELTANGLAQLPTSEVSFSDQAQGIESATSQDDIQSTAVVASATSASPQQLKVEEFRDGHAAGAIGGSLQGEEVLEEQAGGEMPGPHTANSTAEPISQSVRADQADRKRTLTSFLPSGWKWTPARLNLKFKCNIDRAARTQAVRMPTLSG
jgi:hypothetical protein